MNNKRKLIKTNIINIKFVIVNILLFCSYLFYHTKSLEIGKLWLTFPLIVILLIPIWSLINSLILNIKITVANTTNDKSYFKVERNNYPSVAFILPSYNEPFEVAKMTFDSVVNLKYKGKKEIIVVDNSSNTKSKDFKKWQLYVESISTKYETISVKFLYNNKGGLKPGNLDLAQENITDSEYVVFLDIDSTLPQNANIIGASLYEFDMDPSLGWIQFKTTSTNHNFNNCAESVAIFENLLRNQCHFRSYGGFTLFFGHNAMWKKSCLNKLGSWLEEHRGQIMVTEDILKSVIAYNKGYYGKSIPIETGEWVPNSLGALESMWQRWTYGTCQVIGKYFSTIMLSKNMTRLEKYDLLNSIIFYWGNAISLPLIILYQFIFPPESSWLFILISSIIPQIIGGMAIYKHNIKKQKLGFFKKLSIFYTGSFIISSFVNAITLKGTYNYLLGIPQGWKVTEKGFENSENWFSIIRKNKLYLFISVLLISSSILSWQLNYNNSLTKLIYYFPGFFISINLMLNIVLFGKSGRTNESSIKLSTIDVINNNINEKSHLMIYKDELAVEDEVPENEEEKLVEMD